MHYFSIGLTPLPHRKFFFVQFLVIDVISGDGRCAVQSISGNLPDVNAK